MNRRNLALGLVLLTAGCWWSRADHERLGDRAYAAQNFADALLEYQLALRQDADDPALRWKAGLAALNARDLPEAAGQFRTLADQAPERNTLAADGLERVARAASGEGHRAALAAALVALSAVAPERAMGTFSRELAADLDEGGSAAELATVLLSAAAAAPDARLQDSLMYWYARVQIRMGRCDRAVPILEALLRRRREPAIVDDARVRATACALALGRRQRNRGSPDEAERWFVRAIAVGDGNRPARVAYLELGNVRFARGNFEGARDAFLRALEGAGSADSIVRAAQRGLDRLRGFDDGDAGGNGAGTGRV